MRFFRIRDVEKFTGLSRASIYRLMREGKFPRPVRLVERAVAWTIDDLEIWAENRPTASSRSTKSGV
jgi:prophage regulatory protein